MLLSTLIWGSCKALLIAFVLTPIVRDIFRAYNVVDRPGGRTVHAWPTPRVGGISIAIAYAVAILTFFDPKAPLPDYYSEALKLLPGILIVFLTGLMDDFLNLRPSFKLLGQVAGAVAIFASGLRVERVIGFTLPFWLNLLVTVFWLLFATNALNLIDGLDGLCGGMGFLAAMTLFAAGMIRDTPALTLTMLPLAGALLGFLFFNFNPATVFLGDSGALTIGFLLGCGGMIWKNEPNGGGRIAVPLLALSIPLLDVALSILRRFLKGRPIFSADRGHIHHRLLDRGLTTRRAALTLYLMALPGIAAAILLSLTNNEIFRPFVIPGFLVLAAGGSAYLWYRELEMAWKLLFRREFSQTVAGRVRLEQADEALRKSRSDEAWWEVLVAIGRKEGWLRVDWNGTVQTRSQVFFSRPAAWSLRIPLSGEQSVLIEGEAARENEGFDLRTFSSIVRRTVPSETRPVSRSDASVSAVS